MPEVRLNAAELADMLQFLARGLARLAAALEQFTGHPAYSLSQLCGDLERFVFVPGGSHSEGLFGATVEE